MDGIGSIECTLNHDNMCVYLIQEDKQWDWDRLFTEVASELQTEWEKSAAKTDG